MTVRFEVTAGGGSVTGSPATTNASGVASPTAWTLGTVSGRNELRAIVTGLPPVTFEAFATAGAPKLVAAAQGDAQTGLAGSTLPVSPGVVVRDTFANPVPGVTVTFSVVQGGGSVPDTQATTDSAGVAVVGGWTLGPGPGEQRLRATVSGLPPVDLTATATAGPPATVTVSAGQGQSAPAGTVLPEDPSVRVTDAFGNPVPGISVTFTVASGGGSVTGGTSVTNGAGIAAVGSWTLGASPGTNNLTASVAAGGVVGNPVTFNATGTGGGSGPAYDIVLRFNAGSTPTAAQRRAFDTAEARWESVITGDLPDVAIDRPAGTCSSGVPLNETVDDLLIIITLEAIDGAGGVLGSAGPCLIRSGTNLPAAGRMRLDTADLAVLEANGLLDQLVLHEMGHVLGVGSLWSLFSLLADPSLSGGLDPHFTGPGAIAAFDAAGGSGYTGAKVPAEDTGGSGTADAHWRESVMDEEIMTGWLDPGTNPVSAVTISSLADLGYTVDSSAADPLTIPVSASIVPRPGQARVGVQLIGDVSRGPIEVIDERGHARRVIPQ
jgi:hypothetical protein